MPEILYPVTCIHCGITNHFTEADFGTPTLNETKTKVIPADVPLTCAKCGKPSLK